MDNYTSIEEQVKFGLDTINSTETVEVALRDLLYVYQTLGELVRFFHQRAHYPDLDAVNKFLGNRDEGAFHLLNQCYYEKLRDIWPQNVIDKFDEGDFDHPKPPYYYQATSED